MVQRSAHCGLREDTLVDREWIYREEVHDWRQWLASGNESGVDQRIRERTFTGRPCGNETFVREPEQLIGRRLSPRKPGPKPKNTLTDDSTLWTSDEIRF